MLSQILYSIYSGQLFFVAAAVLLVVAALDSSRYFERRSRTKRVARFSALLALALAVFTAPPLPLPLPLLTLALTLLYLFRGFGRVERARVLGAMPALGIIAMIAMELPYHAAPARTPRPSRLVVIGDSLSSGGFGETHAWPQLIGAELAAEAVNLSLPSAHVADAVVRQLPELPTDAATVILAIGGNDMLESTPPARFAADLEQLVASARNKGARQVIMLELPLLPGRWSYGATQRRLARKHHCVLVPKRIIAATLSERRNTSDGIHLTQQGHDDFARRMLATLGWM